MKQRGWWGRHSACLMALLFTTGAARAQQSAVIRTETRVVLVDTIVTDKQGEYVHGLAAKDFHLWEDNKQQTILSVSQERGPATSRPRYLVVFFAPMEAEERSVAVRAVSGFIDANAEENRRMAVVSYNGGLRIGQTFTDDAGRLKAALNGAISSGTDSEALDTIRTLKNMASNLGVLPGRKIVVFVGGGLSQSSIQRAELTAAIEACNKSDVAVYPVDLRPLGSETTPHNQGQVLGSFETADGLGRRAAGGGPQGQKGDSDANIQDAGVPNQQLLFRLASGTGGFVIANSGELQRGLQKIGEEQSEYYVLSFTPSESKEGICHTLRVKVDRSGTTVRARADYCESKPQDLLAGTVTGRDLERRATATQTGTIGASVQFSHFYLSPGVARVNLAMEIPPEALKFQNQKGKPRSSQAELNLLGIASAPDGVVGARFSDALKLDSESQGKPLHYEREFKIVPGRYSFTLTFSAGGESFGRLEIPLVVEPRQAGELGLSGLVLSKETHPAAELGLGGVFDQTSHTPLVANDVQVVPSGSNQFNKSEMGFVYFEVYAQDPVSVRVRARVLDRKTGEPKSDLGLLQLSAPKDGGGIPAGSRLPIGALAAGSYELEVTAVDADGRPVKRTVGFDVK
jgi:VWFA-related protein